MHEFVEVEIRVGGLQDPAREKAARDTLEHLPGVQSVRFDGDHVFVSYEPVEVVKADIEAHLRQAGFEIEEMATAASSPVVDATAESQPPAAPENS